MGDSSSFMERRHGDSQAVLDSQAVSTLQRAFTTERTGGSPTWREECDREQGSCAQARNECWRREAEGCWLKIGAKLAISSIMTSV